MYDKTQKATKDLLALTGNDAEKAIAAIRDAVNITDFVVKDQAPIEPNTNSVVVDVQDITKTYKLGKNKVEALKGVSLQIRESEFIAITGASGSGKSTLLQLIGGLDKPTKGTVVVNNQNIAKLSDGALSHFRNQTIGFVFQFFYLQPFLKVATNIELPAMFARTKHNVSSKAVQDIAESVHLSDRLTHYPKELSGGQMQRAAIARAFINTPKIIIADEPTGNLDSTNANEIFSLFAKLRDKFGTTIIVVTHDIALANKADRQIRMMDGVIQ